MLTPAFSCPVVIAEDVHVAPRRDNVNLVVTVGELSCDLSASSELLCHVVVTVGRYAFAESKVAYERADRRVRSSCG